MLFRSGLDALINGLHSIDREYVEILELRVGGINDDWPAEAGDERFFED